MPKQISSYAKINLILQPFISHRFRDINVMKLLLREGHFVTDQQQTPDLCFSFQRLLSNEEEKNKEIIQEVCFMVSFYHLQTPAREISFCFIPVNHDQHFGQVKHQHMTA